jgi:hypothetical protein
MGENESLKEHLKKLEEKLLKPEVRTSPAELNNLLADDFFEYGSSGNIFFKRDCVVDGGIKVFSMTLTNFEIHILASDVVLATYQVHDETRKRITLRSSVWKYRDERWQMFFHQGTITNLQR